MLPTLSKEAQEKIEILKQSDNIVGLSGGKDSMATCITLCRLGIPFRTITAEVWWKEGVTGENPYHYEFLHEKAIPKLQEWGVKCDTVRSKITAYEYMTTPIAKTSKHPERIGKLRGFPLCGKCGIQRDCKTRPCERFYKQQPNPYNVITGICTDEADRCYSNAANGRISILELLGIRQAECFGICSGEGLLSPTYSFRTVEGVGFALTKRYRNSNSYTESFRTFGTN